MASPPLAPEDLDHILVHTRELWSEVAGQTVCLTGATGFVGSWLVESLLHANDQLHLGARLLALSRDPSHFLNQRPHLAGRDDLEFISGDIHSFSFPESACPLVIHAAANVSTTPSTESPSERTANLVAGTRRVLELAAHRQTARLLQVSSGAVYGIQPTSLDRLTENHAGTLDPRDPGSAYGLGKRACEDICIEQGRREGLEVKIARCFSFVGPHLPFDGRFAIGNFLGDALAGRPITITGDGRPVRSYLYAADLAIWLWTVLIKGRASRPYNVGSPEPINILEAARRVAHTVGSPHMPGPMMPPSAGPAPRYVPDTTRAENELGLKQHIPLDEALRRTTRWYQTNCK